MCPKRLTPRGGGGRLGGDAKPDAAKPADAKPAKKDDARITPPGKVAKEPPKRSGQIAVFISRKDSKLYVRQNLAPLFEVPVTIAPSDRPVLGTASIFTAQVDKGRFEHHCTGRS